MQSKKAITLALLAVTVFFIYYSVNAAPLIDDGNYTYIAGMPWYNTYAKGLEAAQAENKPMLVYGWAIWCKFCEKLHTETYPDPRISSILNESFVRVAIDLDVNKEDASRFGISYPPKLIFLTSNGDEITNIPGYLPADRLLPILEQVRSMSATSLQIPHNLPRTEDRGAS
ncbi:MAG TPA: thioredoxin family protein [Euryarchaeota archaeon]|nr:thiol:disulfide interchange protein precursor [archaeon BMS3Abin16]HDH27959.1 thioredoxin family protein [Euryarchaeota archaeon]HDY73757.1 thioredoxin family protein [Euryarchaeota archaeon]